VLFSNLTVFILVLCCNLFSILSSLWSHDVVNVVLLCGTLDMDGDYGEEDEKERQQLIEQVFELQNTLDGMPFVRNFKDYFCPVLFGW
jgi:hypothetical protein